MMRGNRRTANAWALRVVGGAFLVTLLGCHRAGVRVVGDDSTAARIPVVFATPTPTTRIPRDAARFEIDVVDDSAARFKPREALWVKAGMTAYAVDPTNRDALVARLRVISVWNETAVAVVTSQVTRITTRHVVLLTPPIVPWWKTRRFWIGTLVGAVVGGTVGGVLGAQ